MGIVSSYQLNILIEFGSYPRFLGEYTTRLAPVPKGSKSMLGYQGWTNAFRLLNQDKA